MKKPVTNPEVNMTRAQALVEVGFWQPVDTVVCFLLGVSLLSFIVTASLGALTAVSALIWLVVMLLVLAAWIILVLFRTMWFVLQITAEIKMMPAAASKMVVTFLSGQHRG